MKPGLVRSTALLALLAATGAAWALRAGVDRPQPQSRPRSDTPRAAGDRFAPRLLAIAAEYRQYPLASDSMAWAPARCYAPPGPLPLFSRAERDQAHGSKLFDLYAAHPEAYRNGVTGGRSEQPADQVIVKETWLPQKARPGLSGQDAIPKKPGGAARYARGEKGPLFVMYRTERQASGTDNGWVYGTLTPDGRTVTAVGRLGSCMGCHDHGTYDRLFGSAELRALYADFDGNPPASCARRR